MFMLMCVVSASHLTFCSSLWLHFSLSSSGYEIQIAANGQEVLQMLQSEAKKGPEYEIQCILMVRTQCRHYIEPDINGAMHRSDEMTADTQSHLLTLLLSCFFLFFSPFLFRTRVWT